MSARSRVIPYTAGRAVRIVCLIAVCLPATPTETVSADGFRAETTKDVGRASDVRVDVHRHLISVSANDASIEDVLREIARQSGLLLNMQGLPTGSIRIDLSEKPLDEALRQVLAGHNYLLEYSPDGDGSGCSDPTRRSRLWVVGAGADGNTAGSEKSHGVTKRSGPEPAETTSTTSIDSLLRNLSEGDVALRKRSVYPLARIGTERALAALADALEDEHPEVRREAAYALGDAGATSAVWLLSGSLNDEDRRVRIAAIEALADIGGDGAINALALARQHGDLEVRDAAAEAMAELSGAL